MMAGRARIVATREHPTGPVRLSIYVPGEQESVAVAEISPRRAIGLAGDLLALVRNDDIIRESEPRLRR